MVDNGRGVPLAEPKLAFCEAWLGSMPAVGGVPVSLAMTYDLVQLLHMADARGYQGDKNE